MKKLLGMVAAMGSMVALSGCSEQVMNEALSEGLSEGESVLRVMTRGETTPLEGKVFVFNGNGECVRLLHTDEGGQLASTNLVAGSYTVYAIGGDDLTAYTLPSEDDASANSVITLAEGRDMVDLFMTSDHITLTEGIASNLELELERQVIMIKGVSIKQVPTDVTKVEVSISPLHEGIKLDGTFTDEHACLAFDLTKSSDNKTWTNGDHQPYCFPSDGNPTITVSFTRSDGVKTYRYVASEPFAANHQVVLEGTYSEAQDAILSGTLTAKAWDADKHEVFEFNEENLVESDSSENPEELEVPVAGGTYLGYYVISVNSSDRTAVLLSKTQEKNYEEASAVNAALSSWPASEDVSGTWRLPTNAEMTAFLNDRNVISLEKGKRLSYYYKDGSTISVVELFMNYDEVYSLSNGHIGPNTWLRPVIDITY